MSKKYTLTPGLPVVNRRMVQSHVTNRVSFQISTGQLFALESVRMEWNKRRYGVFSYSDDWPLWVFDPIANTWFTHHCRYSRTTAAHRTISTPWWYAAFIDVGSPHNLRMVFDYGYNDFVKDRLTA